MATIQVYMENRANKRFEYSANIALLLLSRETRNRKKTFIPCVCASNVAISAL